MISVYCFSATGHSRAAARYLAQSLQCRLYELPELSAEPADTAVVVFPVYCQNMPEPVKPFLASLEAKYVALVATYGKMGCGNVLWEAAKLVKGTVIAGAYVPTGHTYLQEPPVNDYSALLPMIDRIRSAQPVIIPRRKKWWLADRFPGLRSRIGVRMKKTDACVSCGLCSRNCPMGSMENGKSGKDCIRCLRCAAECPKQAIQVNCHPLLRFYLRKSRQNEWILYL